MEGLGFFNPPLLQAAKRWHAIRFRKSCYALRALAPFSGWRPIGKSLDQTLTSTDCVHLTFASPVRPPRRSRVTKFGPSKNITDIQNKFRISHIFFGTSSSDFPLAVMPERHRKINDK